MLKVDYDYLGTTLEEVEFNKNILLEEFELTFSITQKKCSTNNLIITGTMNILINSKPSGLIKMNSVFKVNKINYKKEYILSELLPQEKAYFIKPLLSELSLFISILSQKAIRLPFILPIDQFLYDDSFYKSSAN